MNNNHRFINNGDETVTDKENGLMWTRTDSMIDLEKWINYQDAMDYARELREKKFANYDDWRLPKKDELCTLYEETSSIKDKFGKDIHISDQFSPGGGFSMIADLVPGRMRTWVFNLRTGEYSQPDGLWTIADAARAVRTIQPKDK